MTDISGRLSCHSDGQRFAICRCCWSAVIKYLVSVLQPSVADDHAKRYAAAANEVYRAQR